MNHLCRASIFAASIGVSALLTSCSATPTPQAAPTETRTASSAPARPGQTRPIGTPQVLTTGLDAPWSVVFRDGAPLISERDTARILELAEDGSTRAVGTVEGVAAGGEAGLLGLALDARDRLYVYSTASDGNRIQRFDVTGPRGSLSLGQPTTLIDKLPSASYHDGGRIAFGPDDMLYATVGDAGQSSRAQDLDSLNGKILRMTTDGAVPADNPFPDSLVFSYGHRNPQGLTWADDGTMFAPEFGQNTWDELNIIKPGANYGWPTVEGIADNDEFTNPVQQWEPTAASPSGITQLNGTLFIANLRGEVLRAVPVADPSTATDYYVGEYGRIRDVIVTPDDQLWLVTSNTDGRGDPTPEDDRILSVAVEPG